jgi:putative membrane protein
MSEVTAKVTDLSPPARPVGDLARQSDRPAPRGGVMRVVAPVAAVAGLALLTAVLGVAGLRDVVSAVGTIGWRGLITLVICTAAPLTLLGGAWFSLVRDEPLARAPIFIWARLIRDASGELLPFSHVGGFFFGARAAILRGVPARTAFATSIADVTAELIAQLIFTGLGLVWLAGRLDAGSLRDTLMGGALGGLALSCVAVTAFVILQKRGGKFAERLVTRFFPGAAARTADFGAAVQAIYDSPFRIATATLLHLLAWTASGLGSWAALRVAGVDINVFSILALESLVAAVRSAVVVAPMGIGVQEATYAFAGPLFGLGPDLALALSLIKRARDLLIGVPALMVWQGMEGVRAMGRKGPRLASEEAG